MMTACRAPRASANAWRASLRLALEGFAQQSLRQDHCQSDRPVQIAFGALLVLLAQAQIEPCELRVLGRLRVACSLLRRDARVGHRPRDERRSLLPRGIEDPLRNVSRLHLLTQDVVTEGWRDQARSRLGSHRCC